MKRSAVLAIVVGVALVGACRVPETSTQRQQRESSAIEAGLAEAEKAQSCPLATAWLLGVRKDYEVTRNERPTPYGDAVRRWYLRCITQAVAKRSEPGSELDNLRVVLALIDAALSLPVAGIPIEDETHGPAFADVKQLSLPSATRERAELAARLATLEAKHRERSAAQQQRIAMATTAEAREWYVAALAAWTAVEPIDDAMKERKAAAIAKTAPLARAQVAVPVVLEPGPGTTPELLALLRKHEMLRRRVDVRVVERDEDAQVSAGLAVGAFDASTRQDTVTLKHDYVAGRESIANPAYERLQEQIAHEEERAAYFERKAEDVNCSRSSECRTRDERRRTAREHREKAQRLRQALAREQPTKIADTTRTHEYPAQRTTVTMRSKLAVTVTLRGGAPGAPIEGVASVEKAALRAAGNPTVNLPPRMDPMPAQAELEPALRTEIVRLLANGVSRAAPLTAPALASRLAATSDPLERAQYALLIGLRTGTESDKAAARKHATTALGGEPSWSELAAALKPVP
ncbi:MAG: hypothetical protein SFX73_18590 [Kofleriaceae bacterium]|nr:hypothetical protein [Kofleriaceae bacterium]